MCLTLDLLRAGLTSGRAAHVLQTQHTEVSGNSSGSTGLVFVCFISAAYALLTEFMQPNQHIIISDVVVCLLSQQTRVQL